MRRALYVILVALISTLVCVAFDLVRDGRPVPVLPSVGWFRWDPGKSGEHPHKDLDDWKTPFEIDITGRVRPGKKNRVVVRVEDNAGAGEI